MIAKIKCSRISLLVFFVFLIVIMCTSDLLAQEDPCGKFWKTKTETYKAECLPSDEGVFKIIKNKPKFGNGYDDLNNYLTQNIEICGLNNIQNGKLVLYVNIDKEGRACLLTIRGENLRDSVFEAYVDQINKMPKWKPGTMNGAPKYVTINIEIEFKNSIISVKE